MSINDITNFESISNIQVVITVELGKTKIAIKDLLKLANGAIVELDTYVGKPLNFFVNGKLFGSCDIVQVNGKFGMRIVEIFKK